MSRKVIVQIIASTIGIALILMLITFSVDWLSPDIDNFEIAVICNLIVVVIAISEWSGVVRKKKNSFMANTWGDWLVVFVVGLGFSIFFLFVDCGWQLPTFHPKFLCKGTPGITVIFTIAAVCMVAIALPSAVRAWILEKYEKNHRE